MKKRTRSRRFDPEIAAYLADEARIQTAEQSITRRRCFVDVIEVARTNPRKAKDRIRVSRRHATERELDSAIRAGAVRHLIRTHRLHGKSTTAEVEAQLATYDQRNPERGKRALKEEAQRAMRQTHERLATGALGIALAESPALLRLLIKLWSYARNETMLCIEAIIAAAAVPESERNRLLKRDEIAFEKHDSIQRDKARAVGAYRKMKTDTKPGRVGARLVQALADAGVLGVDEKAATESARKLGLRPGLSTDELKRVTASIAKRLVRVGRV